MQYLRNDQLGSSLITVAGGTLDLNTRLDSVGPVLLQSGSISGTTGTLFATSYDLQSGSVSARLAGSTALGKTTSGTVTLSGVNSYSGATQVTGGTLVVQGGSAIPDSSAVSLAAGSQLTVTDTETIGSLAGGGDVQLTGSAALLTGGNHGSTTMSGRILGGAANLFGKQGGGTLTLAGTAGNTVGSVGMYGGTLELNKTPGVGVVASTGTLSASDGTIRWLANSQLNGAALNLVGGVADLNGASDTARSLDISSGAQLIIPTASTLTVTLGVTSHGNLALNGTLAAGGTIDLASGTTVHGSGTFQGNVNLLSGAILSPGNSPGTMSIVGNANWAGGGNYLFEINDALGNAGSDPGWDLLDITGSLTITATVGDEFTLDVDSLLLSNTPGDAANFNSASNYSWTFASAAGGVVGFDPLAFLLDLSGFSNPYPGMFSVALLGNDLNLVYTAPAAVPEPGTLVMWSFLGLGGAVAYRRRLRKQTRPAAKAG